MTTPQDVQEKAAALLAPISAAQPGGDNASYDPAYEVLRQEVTKLDSLSGGEVDWDRVVRDSRAILTAKSKDYLVACYHAYALYETQKLPGLAVGLALLEGMFETYWETGFPPVKRARGRGNALGWFMGRLEIALPTLPVTPTDRPALDVVVAGFRALAGIARDKLEDNAPPTQAVSTALERINLKIPKAAAPAAPPPAAAPAASAAAAPPPAPAATAEPTPPPLVATPAVEPAPASAPAPAPAPTPAAPPPAAPPKKDWLAEAQEAAKPWLEPLAPAPHGIDARYEAEFEAIRAEVAKLDSPSGDASVKWDEVVRNADALLKKKSKDLLVASYLAYARLQTQGIEALGVGLAIVTGLLETFAEVWPSRPRGRGNALTWLTEQLERQLGTLKLEPKHRDAVEGLQKIVRAFGLAARDKLEDNAPSLRPLEDRVQRMLLAIPKPEAPKPAAPPPPSPTPAPAPAPAASAPAPAPAPAPAAAPMPAAAAAAGSPEEVGKYLLETGRALVKAANLLRQAQPHNPAAYRLMRTAVWLHLDQAPPAAAGNKTQIPALPAPRRQQLSLMESNAKWQPLLEETESALMQFRFCLDLQRLSAMALQRLGDAYEPARQALLGEVATLLRRMPGLPDLLAADGTPLCDEQTRAWIASDVVVSGGAKGGGGQSDDPGEPFPEVVTLLRAGKLPEAMKLAKQAIDGTPSPRLRLIRRLALAQGCLEAGQPKLARSLYAALDREITERNLVEWEPALAASCLEGLVRAIRAAAQKGSQYAAADAVFERLCHIDPIAAAALAG
jgi:type VI secretion system ImpA/VasJ family protein